MHRETGFDRKTIRKYINQYEEKRQALLHSGENKLILTDDIVESLRYDTSNRTKIKLTDKIIDKIDLYLKENELKKTTGRSKQKKKK